MDHDRGAGAANAAGSPAARAAYARRAYRGAPVARRAVLTGALVAAFAAGGAPAAAVAGGVDRLLYALLVVGIVLASVAALPLAVAVARPVDGREPRWTAAIVAFGWGVALAFALGRLSPVPPWRLGTTAVGYAAFVAVIAASAWAPSRAPGLAGRPKDALTVPAMVLRAAFALWLVGAGWFVVDAFGLRPLGFSPLIVRLTAVHFHFAAFVLPVIAAVVAAAYPNGWTNAAAAVSLVGVPSTALGITAAQLGAPPWVEAVFAAPMVAGALQVGAVHLALASGAWAAASGPAVRALRLIVGLTLLGTMGLAAAYAARGWLPWAPTIPQMVVWHGIGNAFGVSLCGLVACWNDPATWSALRPSTET